MFPKVCGKAFLAFSMLFNPTNFIDLRTCRIVSESVTSILIVCGFRTTKELYTNSLAPIVWSQVPSGSVRPKFLLLVVLVVVQSTYEIGLSLRLHD